MARRISGALAAALLLGLAAAVLAADVERHHDGDDDYAPHHAGKVKVVIEKPEKPPKEPKSAFLQANFVTCPDPYSSFTLVTRLSICSNANGVITGLTYFNDHPKRRTDPVTVCDNSAANTCTDIDLFDPSVDGYKTITTVRVSKAKDAEAKDVAVTCLALGFSDGSTQEFGLCDANIPGLTVLQWNQPPKGNKICGLNGVVSSAVCDKKTGLLKFIKPCYTCAAKPKEPKPPKPVKEKVVIVKEVVAKEPKVHAHKDKPHKNYAADAGYAGGYAAAASTAAAAPAPSN